VPSLSFESNYLTVCYSKQLFEKYGWSEPTDWESLLNLLAAAKAEGYTSPLALNYDKSGVEGIMFGYTLYMYLDQYFRDIIDVAHSQDGDFSYIEEVDSDWVYSADDSEVDMRSGYTYNISRLIDAYFNGTEYNATSARFADMMANYKELLSYSSPTYTSGTARNAFHNGVLTELGGTEFKKSESAVLYVCRMDYLSDFQSSIGSVLKFEDERIPADQLENYLGWFNLPAMTDNSSVEGGAPAATNVRTFGGPNHHPMGVLNHNDQKRTALVMDFMMFWYSPEGMDYYYENYGNKGIVCPLKCLVKNYDYPENIQLDAQKNFNGICVLNPYFEVGLGYDSAVQSSDGGTVRDKYVSTIRDYLDSGTNDWSSYGVKMDAAVRSGFSDWASRKNMKISSPEEIKNYIVNSPFKITQ
jgi:ABC-type glycerol-3-phosphate transport system substrate-binding protein